MTSASIVQQFIDLRGETQKLLKTAYGHLVMQSAGKKLIDRLSRDKRDEIIAIGRAALCRFGYSYQHVFDAHLQLFEFLAEKGATATMIGQMLSEVGITREDGTALPPGTVSSSISRARERRAARPSEDHRPAPAPPGADMQVAAVGGDAMREPADRATRTGAIMPDMAPLALAPSRSPAQLSQVRPSRKPSAQLPTATRRAAALLEELRRDHPRPRPQLCHRVGS